MWGQRRMLAVRQCMLNSHQYSCTFCCRAAYGNRGAVWQNGVRQGRAYNAKVWSWIAPCGKNCTLDIHWHLPNIYGDQKVNVNSVKQRVLCFSSGNTSRKDKKAVHICHTMKGRLSGSAHAYESVDCEQEPVYRAEHCISCFEKKNVTIAIEQSLHQVGTMKAHPGTERTVYASLSGTTEPIHSSRWQFPGSHH